MTMTNFDKWKSSLKPERFVRPDIVVGAMRVVLYCGDNCPVKDCPVIKNFIRLTKIKEDGGWPTKRQMEAHRRIGRKCATWFLRWANAPAKEEE